MEAILADKVSVMGAALALFSADPKSSAKVIILSTVLVLLLGIMSVKKEPSGVTGASESMTISVIKASTIRSLSSTL